MAVFPPPLKQCEFKLFSYVQQLLKNYNKSSYFIESIVSVAC
jgi:hypothetical protein